MRIRKLVTAWALGALLAAARLAAGTPSAMLLPIDPEAGATIALTPVAERWDGGGFMPVRVRIENRAPRARAWTLHFITGRGYSGHEIRHAVMVTAEADSIQESVVFVAGGAPDPHVGASLRVEGEGPGAERSYTHCIQTGSGPVIVTATTPARESALFSATNGAPGPAAEISAVDPARWPADWRTWSPFHRVVLLETEYAALDSARRAALREWVALGGTLDLYRTAGRGEPGVELVGLGAIRRQRATLEDEATSRPFVSLHVSALPGLQSMRGVEVSAERRKELSPATGALGLSFFLLAFGVLVGPVNLFVFAPAHRRQRLFFTVPLISLVASVLMGVYIVVKDGFGGEGAQRGFVLLLPESNQALVRQQQVARTGVLIRASFELPDEVAAAQGGTASGLGRGGNEESLVLERGSGSAGGDWFASRRVQEQTLTRIVPTRARVELVGGGVGEAAPVVQSSVGVVLRDFRYLDARGYVWSAPEVAPGVRVTLRAEPVGATTGMQRGGFAARGGAAEGLAPIPTLGAIRWDEPEFLYAGPLTGARTP